LLDQAKYKEDYEKNKGRNFTEIPETNEMVLSKELRPVQSKKLYGMSHLDQASFAIY